MPTKIVLINVHSSLNAGDAALTEVTVAQLEKKFHDIEIEIVMNDPMSYYHDEKTLVSFLTWVNQSNIKPIFRFFWLIFISAIPALTKRMLGKAFYLPLCPSITPTIKSLIDADLVISSAGGYYYSYAKGRAFLYISYTLALVILAGNPLYMLPQSYGPFQYWYERIIAKWLLPRVNVLMVREPESLEYLNKLRIHNQSIHLFPDMAFSFNGSQNENSVDSFMLILNKLPKDQPLLGITVIDWGTQYLKFSNQDQYEQSLVVIIKHFINNYNGSIILFPQSCGPSPSEDDRIPAMRIINRLSEFNGRIILIDNPLRPDVLKTLFGYLDILIGTRMHSNIFAMIEGTPVIAIGYLPKTFGMASMVGIENWVIAIEDINPNVLMDKLDELWKDRELVHRKLLVRIPELAAQTPIVLETISRDYTQHFTKI